MSVIDHPTPGLSRDQVPVGAPPVTRVRSTTFSSPTDRVRWPAVLAGLFMAVSVLALLSVLGLAIGLSSYDAYDSGRTFAIGSGIWAIVSALIAFFVGGFVAAKTSALRGRETALWNGAVVWAVAIPLTAYLAASVAGTLARTTGAVAATTAETATSAAQAAAQTDPDAVESQANQAANSIEQQASEARQAVQNTSAQDVREGVATAARESRGSVWGTLAAMVLALVAALAGSALGATELKHRTGNRLDDDSLDDIDHDHDRH